MRRKKRKPRADSGSSLPPHSSPVIQVAAGLIECDGRYLIARRSADAHLGGFWEFPGGKREPHESLEDCLRRELREELGIEVTTPLRFHQVTHAYPDAMVELHFFRCSPQGGTARPLACEEVRWVRPEELPSFEFPEADAGLIALISEGRKLEGSRHAPMDGG